MEHDDTNPRFTVGAMSGTSIDSLDAALVRIEGAGLDMRAALVRHESAPLGGLSPRLRAIAEQRPVTAEEIAAVVWELGELHVSLIERLLDSPSHRLTVSPSQPCIIAAHGQTVFHRPPISWQLINPAPIVSRWPESRVISDIRQHDLAMGGQGAPITPLADWILFRSESQPRAIVNLGGFCNVTILPASQGRESLGFVRGFDVCACNHVLDGIAREVMNVPFDEGGRRALAGSVDAQAERELLDALSRQRAAARSLGTGDELSAWIDAHRSRLRADDLAATACSAIGRAIANAVGEHKVEQVVLAGGGAMNEALVRAIASSVRCETIRSDALGVPVQAREAMAMAILGALRADDIAITLPQVTGRSPLSPWERGRG